jgi:hypothetical protein
MWLAPIVLVALEAVAHDPGTISGRVKDPAGHPQAGVKVQLEGAKSIECRTEADGSFRFEGLLPGRFTVQLSHPAFSGLKRAVSLERGHGAELELTLHPFAATATVEVSEKAGFVQLSDLDAPLNHLLGIADSAGEGIITPEQVQRRPYQRPGDVLENVPGLLISQHSGEGKANQYYLRGFNLDHGTDLRTTVAGMPVNEPTHGHGQGYTDLGFLIPELVTSIQYKKGGHFADEGDFATAGAVNLNYAHSLPQGLAQIEGGSFGYGRALLAASPELGGGHLLYAAEGVINNGPWDVKEGYRKANVVLRWSRAWDSQQFSLTGMSYDGRWTSTDQAPQRAFDQGLIGRYGTLDPTDGGRSFRRSLSADWQRTGLSDRTKVNAYLIHQQLQLFSNFTYFLADPVNGDQFEQLDRRVVAGIDARQSWEAALGDRPMELQAGLQLRQDNIAAVGLYATVQRERLSTTRQDRVREGMGGAFLQAKVQWSDAFRSTLGLRGDRATFQVRSSNPLNSGSAGAGLLSPKLALAFGPWSDTEFYLNAGEGFHSNDARGTTLRVDPKSGDPAERVTPLVRAKSYEVGLRSAIVPSWQTTLTLWRLDLGSELVFSGDGGTTEPSRPSRRMGVEWANDVQFGPKIALEANVAWSRARYTDEAPAGNRVPGAVGLVGSLGLVLRPTVQWQVGVSLREVGQRDLIEDGSSRSKASTLLQANLRYKPSPAWSLGLELFNVANAKTSDIEYVYTSRLRGEPAVGVEGVHTHPAEPFSLRATLTWTF